MQKRLIMLASYPRSGNTYLRTILWHCFKLPSASVYQQDLLGAKTLEKYVGHVEIAPGDCRTGPEKRGIQAVKTHKYPVDDTSAIYVVRDGRAASVSLWEFIHRKITLDELIEGGISTAPGPITSRHGGRGSVPAPCCCGTRTWRKICRSYWTRSAGIWASGSLRARCPTGTGSRISP